MSIKMVTLDRQTWKPREVSPEDVTRENIDQMIAMFWSKNLNTWVTIPGLGAADVEAEWRAQFATA